MQAISPHYSDRFWSKVNIGDPTKCWLWKGRPSTLGYGQFGLYDRQLRAHRVAFELFHHRKPRGHVLHRCGNKMCVNPHHLYEGDDVDNSRDLYIEGGGRRKLSNEEVIEIRRLHETGQYLYKELAKRFGVSRQSIGQMLSGQTHTHI